MAAALCASTVFAQYSVSTIAGGAPPPTPIDGTSVAIGLPGAVILDASGNVYFTSQNCVFKLNPAGVVTLVAGNSTAGFSGDGGPATSAQLSVGVFSGLAFDGAGNLYVADIGNNRIREVSVGGTITTVAGNGTAGYSGDGGPATLAELNQPEGVAVDSSGNLYIADTVNQTIRKVSSGTIGTVGGAPPYPLSVAVDPAGNLYIGGSGEITRVSVGGALSIFAGTGTRGYSGDGGLAISAQIGAPTEIALDATGNVYFADQDYARVRKVSTSGIISTVAGDGVAAGNYPGLSQEYGSGGYIGDGGMAINAGIAVQGVASDSAGDLYIADSSGFRIAKVSAAGVISTLAGDGYWSYSGDNGPATSAQLASPRAVAVDNMGNVYIADSYNARVRKISASGTITTVAGDGISGYNGDGGPAISAEVGEPSGVAVDGSGNLYISDLTEQSIREVSSAGNILTLIGNGSSPYVNTTFLSVALDGAGHLYFTYDTYPISGEPNVDINGYYLDEYLSGNRVGIAGSACLAEDEPCYSGDGGPAKSAALSYPSGTAIDAAGNVYIADSGNSRIRKISTTGIISTVAGTGVVGYSGDGGPATSAELNNPYGVAVDNSGNLYITDTHNDRVREVSSSSGIITTIASGGALSQPTGIAVDEVGRVYVTDPTNQSVLLIQPIGPTPQLISFGELSNVTIPATPFTLTAVATSGLAVVFTSNTMTVCTISGSTVTVVGAGECSITANQSGNSTYAPAPPVTQAFIAAGSTAQTISFASPGTLTYGSNPVTLTATSTSGLTVSLVSNTTSVCNISGVALTMLSTGSCSVAASQIGNATYAPAAPVTQTFTIALAPQTITFTILNATTLAAGSVPLSATASSGLAVVFTSNSAAVCTVSGSVATLAATGTCSITASQPGNADYLAATSLTQTFTVSASGQTSQAITFGAIASQPYGSGPLSLGATASSNLTVSYTSTTTAVCTVIGTVVTLVSVGTCSIMATQSGSTVYAAATPVTQAFQVTLGVNTITFASPGTQMAGNNVTISATSTSGLQVAFASTTNGVCTVSGNMATLLSSGTCSITATQAGNTLYAAATPVTQSFTVNPASSGGGGGGGGSNPLILSPTSVTINAGAGMTPGTQTVTLSYQTFTEGAPSFSANFSTNQGQGWLAVSPSFGMMTQSSESGLQYTYSATITIIANPSGIPAGSEYTGTVNFSSAGSIIALPITLNVSAQPAKFNMTPGSLSFTYQQGSAEPAAQTLYVFSVPPGSGFAVSATSAGGNWLSASAGNASPLTPGAVSVAANAAGLAPGTYSGEVTITAGTSVTLNVPVTLNVATASPPALQVSPGLETFSVTRGGTGSGQVTITNAGGGTLSFSAAATSDKGWLNLTGSGTGSLTASSSASLPFTFNASGLQPGVYNGRISITDSSGQLKSVAMIVLTVTASAGQIQLSGSGISFVSASGSQQSQTQTIYVSASGANTLNWTAQPSTLNGGNWLSVTPGSGTSTSGHTGVPISITANPSGLSAGQYFGSVNITSPNSVNSPQTISVMLTVLTGQAGSAVQISSGGVLLTGTAGSQTRVQAAVTLYNVTSPVVTYSSQGSASWLSLSPATGSLNPGATTLQISGNFSALSSGLQSGTIGLGFGDGSSATIQVVALVLPAVTGNAVAGSRSALLKPMTTMATCAGGKASFLIPVFQQPFAGATVQTTGPATVQVQVIDDCGNPVTAAAGGLVQVTFSNGDAGINLNDVGSGIWQTTWTPVKAANQVVLQIAASENGLTLNPAADPEGSITVTVQSAASGAAPQPTGIANAASAGQAVPQIVSPGSYIAIYGTGMAGTGNPNATAGQPLPTTLNGAQLTLGGFPMPLLYASAAQINAIVPQEIAPNATYPLVIVNGTSESVPVPVTVTELQPGAYTVDTSGSGAGVVADALTGQLIMTSNPAHASQNLVIYATGLGSLVGAAGQSEPTDGSIAPLTTTYTTTASVKVSIGGISAPVSFSGLTPTLTGLYQVNVQVPAGIMTGNSVPVIVTATDSTTGATSQSNTVTIAVN